MVQLANNLTKVGLLSLIITTQSSASDLTFGFDNPSFSGNGYSTHVLSIEQLQHNRKKEIEDDAAAEARRAEREAENETIQKFLKNVESRIYAQLSKQMVDSMFTDTGDTSGTAEIDGSTIYWVKDETSGTITIQITGEDGTFTELIVPITGFGF